MEGPATVSSLGEVAPNAEASTSTVGSFRAIFVDASVYYVDQRGEHVGLLSESVDAQEDRCRLNTVCNSERWLSAAVVLGTDRKSVV